MPNITIQRNHSGGGLSCADQFTIACNKVVPIELSLAAAKVGSLTTRTDNDTGTLTMNAGHGITTGARLDIFWTENGVPGQRRGVVVGTVAVNSVPIDLGAGDNLPSAAVAITAMVPTAVDYDEVGNNVQAIIVNAEAQANIVLTDNSDVEKAAYALHRAGQADQWFVNNGIANPLAGASVGKVYMAHGDSTGIKKVRIVLGVNS